MHPLLDPRVEHDGPPALTAEQYATQNSLAIEDLKTLSKNRLAAQVNSTMGAASGTGSATGSPSQQGSSPVGTPQPQLPPQLQPQPQTQPAAPSPTPTAVAPIRPTPVPTPNSAASNTTARPPSQATSLPPGILSLPEVRKIMTMTDAQKQVLYTQVRT